jgi:ectoine hydroxylase-related dioxygenase (phytanoyl-CoA dioxygenase family)
MGPDRRLGLVVGDEAVTLRTTGSGVAVDPGVDDAPVVVAMDADAFAAVAAEDLSVFGVLYSGRLEVTRGGFDRFAAWEAALQAFLFDRPVYDAQAAARAGVDPARVWTLDDDPAAIAEALEREGFLHIRDVFTTEEIAVLSAEVDRLRAESSPGDRTSWWAGTDDGEEVCCRVTYMAQRSQPVAALATDERLARIAALTGLDLRCAHDRLDGISVVVKNPGATTGLSDLPWHRDCGLGGHPVLCPGVNIGIQLDRADAEHGQLWFLPGSHRHGGPLGDPVEAGFDVVAIDAEPGDVTVHYGHVLHAAPPPTGQGAGRRAVYVGFAGPRLFETIPAGKAYNDVIYAEDGTVRNVAERAGA